MSRRWREAVHGHIDRAEHPVTAALREMREETGLSPERLYNLSRVELFYQHAADEVAVVPVFCAIVPAGSRVVVGPEHDDHAWLDQSDAECRWAWPRERRAMVDILRLLPGGAAGPVDDVLQVNLNAFTQP
jgi:dATP pyrophosphohydrolase